MPIITISVGSPYTWIGGRTKVATSRWPNACTPFPTFDLFYNETSAKVFIGWNSESENIMITRGTISVTAYGDLIGVLELKKGEFPPFATEGFTLVGPAVDTTWVYTVTIEIDLPEKDAKKEVKEAGSLDHLISSFTPTLLCRVSNNVCFSFPRTGRQLWINEDVLRKINSPYFETLFSSGFAESSNVELDETPTYPPYTFEDSDVEQDKQSAGKLPSSKKNDKSTEDGASSTVPYKTVEILDTTWTTYYAVLCWIGTRYIEFAPLLSSNLFPVSTSSPLREKANNSCVPPAVSPKSVYRLAHLLEITELADLALDNFKSQLTVENAAHELYTDVASSYPALRDIVLDFVVDHCKQVVASVSYRQLLEGTGTEQLDGLTGLLLGERLAKKGSFT